MKTSKRNKLLGLALIGSYSLFNASSVFAAAGDIIANRATLNYDVGGSTQTLIESGTGGGNSTPGLNAGNDTDFTEDRIINFTVVRGGTTGNVVPNGTLQSTTFTVTNTGNGAQGFLLKGLNNPDTTPDPFLGTADEFDATLVQTFKEDGTVPGGYDPADTDAFIDTLAVGASVDVYVVSTIPLNDSGSNPLVNGNVAVMTLVAQAAVNNTAAGAAADAIMSDDNGNASTGGNGFTNGAADLTPLIVAGVSIADDPATEQAVFNDPASASFDGAGNADIAQNAQNSDVSSYTVATASLTVTKAVPVTGALWDPINDATDPKSIPGGYVTYTITIANSGAGAADLTTLSDVLTAELDLDPDFITNAGPGNPTNVAGDSFRLVHSAGGAGSTQFCTGDVAPGDADGCSYTGGAGGTIAIDINAVMGGAPFATLANGESLTIEFNVIVQ